MLNFHDFIEYDFLLYAFIGTFFLALSCGLISPLIIARKNAFMGAAISHSTLLGLSISMAIFSDERPWAIFLLTLALTLCLTLFLAFATYKQKLPHDSLIGIFYTSTMALGIIIHQVYAKNQGDLLSFLFGNILLLNPSDLILGGVIFLIIFLIVLIPLKRWLFLTYDQEGALTSGIRADLYHSLFFVVLTLLIVTSLKLAGTLLVETLLLVPGLFALKMAKSMKATFLYSTLFSVFFSLLGIILSNHFSLPSGATLAVTLFLGLVFSFALERAIVKIRSFKK